LQLRCTLIETKIISLTIFLTKLEQINIQAYSITRFYSTYSYTHDIVSNLNPFFVTGLTDAEGTFVCIVKKSAGHRLKWRVEIVFQIALHKKDLNLLKQIQAFFVGIGNISTDSAGMCAFKVTSSKQILNKIIPLPFGA
jgi:hypothetical protein